MLSTAENTVDLVALLAREDVGIAELARALDAAPHETRRLAVRALNREAQRRLYRKASASPPVTLLDFVPEGCAALQPVRHFGWNTLPLPAKHRAFEKRFCRPPAGPSRLFGYNEAPSRRWVGPGYFVALEMDPTSDFLARGNVVIDYFRVPDAPVPPDWPAVVQNSRGLSYFVYNRTRDYMRKVSEHVSVGAAYKDEEPLDHYFVLVRNP